MICSTDVIAMSFRVVFIVTIFLLVPLVGYWNTQIEVRSLKDKHEYQRNSMFFYMIHTKNIDNEGANVSVNVSEIAIAKVILNNGSCLNFSSVDDVLYMIYNGTLSLDDIKQLNMTTIDEYMNYIDALNNGNKSINITYIASRKLFFSEVEGHLEKYNGTIVPVSEDDYLYYKHGVRFPRNLLYGSVDKFEIYDFRNNETLNIFSLNYNLFILVYINGSDNYTVQSVLENINAIIRNHSDVSTILIDISNSMNISEYNLTENIILTYDNKTTMNNITSNGTLTEFIVGRNFSNNLPLVIILDHDGWIWWKDIGFTSIPELSLYISMYLEDGVQSLPVYPILDIAPIKPHAGESCDVYIIVGQGFGDILSVKLFYEIRDAENKTITRSSQPVSVDLSTLSYRIELDENARWLILNATVISEFGEYSSQKYVFKVEYTERPPKKIPEIVWQILFAVIVVISVIIVSLKIYRKYYGG